MSGWTKRRRGFGSSGRKKELPPWKKGNSELITASISNLVFNVTPILYRSGNNTENITASVTDLSFVVSHI